MSIASAPNPCLGLFTDLYEITMAYGYWKNHLADTEAVFHLFFRHHPFKGGFSVACGLRQVIEHLQQLSFNEEAIAYLAALAGADGKNLFEPAFLSYLQNVVWSFDLDGVAEGTVVFPQEPLLRVQGPLLQCQLLETALLNIVNFQTLIATKAARICLAAEGAPVIEFGLRRAHGMGGLMASRAAYIGGCAATSNVLAGQQFGIPVRGTHAHSWVMAFNSEADSFRAYANAMPNNCVFLVDTYDSLKGVARAIAEGQRLRKLGHELAGIRLDSGDLAYLSIEARRMLDEAGFRNAIIVASNDLDEYTIASIKQQGAKIDVWGVGTRLVTGHEESALGGVYKLAAIRPSGQPWQYRIKLSEQPAKISIPGRLQIRRFRESGEFVGDLIYDLDQPQNGDRTIFDPVNEPRCKKVSPGAESDLLLVPVVRGGRLIYLQPPINDLRDRTKSQLAGFHPGIKRLLNPHAYPVGLSAPLSHLRHELIVQLRQSGGA